MKIARLSFLLFGALFLSACSGHRSVDSSALNCSPQFTRLYIEIQRKTQATRTYLGFKLTEEDLQGRTKDLMQSCNEFFPRFEKTECFYRTTQGETKFLQGQTLKRICKAATSLLQALKKEEN